MIRAYFTNQSGGRTFFFLQLSNGSWIFTDISQNFLLPEFKGNYYGRFEEIPSFLQFLTGESWQDCDIYLRTVETPQENGGKTPES